MTSPLTVQQIERLHADLHPSRVSNRDGGGGRQLSYLEAYDVRATLIRIFGYGGFSGETLETRIVHESQYPSPSDPNKTLWRIAVICTYRLTIPQTGAVYTESAAASQSGPDYGEVLDFAIKTAESDALKRCATNLGTTFGLSLYEQGKKQDVVRVVFAPEQYAIVADLNEARQGGESAAAARERMQARLKTHPTGPEADVTTVEPTEPVEPSGEETAPANEPTVEQAPTEPVSDTGVDHVQKAADDLAKVTRTRKARTPRAGSLAAVS